MRILQGIRLGIKLKRSLQFRWFAPSYGRITRVYEKMEGNKLFRSGNFQPLVVHLRLYGNGQPEGIDDLFQGFSVKCSNNRD